MHKNNLIRIISGLITKYLTPTNLSSLWTSFVSFVAWYIVRIKYSKKLKWVIRIIIILLIMFYLSTQIFSVSEIYFVDSPPKKDLFEEHFADLVKKENERNRKLVLIKTQMEELSVIFSKICQEQDLIVDAARIEKIITPNFTTFFEQIIEQKRNDFNFHKYLVEYNCKYGQLSKAETALEDMSDCIKKLVEYKEQTIKHFDYKRTLWRNAKIWRWFR